MVRNDETSLQFPGAHTATEPRTVKAQMVTSLTKHPLCKTIQTTAPRGAAVQTCKGATITLRSVMDRNIYL
ncbi:hypothetical protein STEG23_008902 [Scotinomys teguina]